VASVNGSSGTQVHYEQTQREYYRGRVKVVASRIISVDA